MEPPRRTLSAWWTEDLFAGAGPVGRPLSRRTAALGLAGVTALAAVLLFLRLSCPLREPDEAGPAEGARRLLTDGPMAAAEPWPLHTWVVLGSFRVLGVHDWAARAPSAAVGVLTVLATGLWGWRLLGPRAGLAAAVILVLSARFLFLGRLVAPDGLMGLTLLGALALGHAAVDRPALGWRAWLASAAVAGLGWLAGGPAVLAAVVVAVEVFTRLDRRTARPTATAWAAYLTVALGLPLPWIVVRPAVAAGAAPNGVSAVLALAALGTGMLPWGLLAPALVAILVRRSPRASASRPPALGFLLVGLAAVLAVSLGVGGPAMGRLLPVLPLAALALAVPLARLPAWSAAVSGRCLAVRGTQVALAAAALVALAALAGGLVSAGAAAALAGGAALAGLALSQPLPRLRPAVAWSVCGATTLAVLVALAYHVLPGYHRRAAVRGQVRAVAEAGGDTSLPVVCYPRRFDSVGFYLDRDDVRAFTAAEKLHLLDALRDRPETLLFAETGPALEDLLGDLPPGMEFIRRGRVGLVTAGTVRYRPEPPAALLARLR